MSRLEFCCPRCRGSVDERAERYDCQQCGAVYPIIAGIPDFRVYPDPYISLEADQQKGRYLAEEARRLSFTDLVAHYYTITPEVTSDQATRFQAHHVAGVVRGRGILDRLTAYGLVPSDQTGHWLDLGCGTGGFLAAAGGHHPVIGVDIAFRWLIVGRRRLTELGFDDIPLVCACADSLPFPDQSFRVIVAENLIEHTPDARASLREMSRVRLSNGAIMARTVNRFALAPEPHVGLWGVGFLPRRAMDGYVRFRKGIPYQKITLQSYPGLSIAARSLGDRRLRVRRPEILTADYQHHAPAQRRLFSWYARLGEMLPPARPALTLFGPYLDIVRQPD